MKWLTLAAVFFLSTSYTGQSSPMPQDGDSIDGFNREIISLNEKLKQYGKVEDSGLGGDVRIDGDVLLVTKEVD